MRRLMSGGIIIGAPVNIDMHNWGYCTSCSTLFEPAECKSCVECWTLHILVTFMIRCGDLEPQAVCAEPTDSAPQIRARPPDA